MKIILWMLILTAMAGMATTGCASKQYSESSYQDKEVLEQYIREHPDFYWKMKTEQP